MKWGAIVDEICKLYPMAKSQTASTKYAMSTLGFVDKRARQPTEIPSLRSKKLHAMPHIEKSASICKERGVPDFMERSWKCPVIRLDPADNIVVARQPIAAGTFIPEEGITVKTDIPIGHKIASRRFPAAEPVWKYNTVIGYASRDVDAGTHMHNDTIHFDAVSEEYHFCQDYHPVEVLPPEKQHTFLGYVRPDGQVGTRNCIGVIVCSNCAATVARKVAAHFTEAIMAAYPHVDAVVPLITSSGCGLEKSGDPLTYLRRVLGGHVIPTWRARWYAPSAVRPTTSTVSSRRPD